MAAQHSDKWGDREARGEFRAVYPGGPRLAPIIVLTRRRGDAEGPSPSAQAVDSWAATPIRSTTPRATEISGSAVVREVRHGRLRWQLPTLDWRQLPIISHFSVIFYILIESVHGRCGRSQSHTLRVLRGSACQNLLNIRGQPVGLSHIAGRSILFCKDQWCGDHSGRVHHGRERGQAKAGGYPGG